MIVQQEFDRFGWHITDLQLGEATIKEEHLSATELMDLDLALQKSGLQLMDNKKEILVERIKIIVIEMINKPEAMFKENFSIYLSRKMGYNYTYMANMFLNKVGMCIEKYIIAQKIEKVKALLQQEDLNLTQISYLLCYNSVAHLSAQFKKVTGTNASNYRKGNRYARIALDKL